ncbi:MAG TPA: hypothetical protein VGN42_22060 [Pirellulales bacterium]|nr:hypothetical protein [Pirellulales bacterium]
MPDAVLDQDAARELGELPKRSIKPHVAELLARTAHTYEGD